MTDQPAWFAPLAAELGAAADDPGAIAAIFERLRAELGPAEAGRRWWALFAEADATHT